MAAARAHAIGQLALTISHRPRRCSIMLMPQPTACAHAHDGGVDRDVVVPATPVQGQGQSQGAAQLRRLRALKGARKGAAAVGPLEPSARPARLSGECRVAIENLVAARRAYFDQQTRQARHCVHGRPRAERGSVRMSVDAVEIFLNVAASEELAAQRATRAEAKKMTQLEKLRAVKGKGNRARAGDKNKGEGGSKLPSSLSLAAASPTNVALVLESGLTFRHVERVVNRWGCSWADAVELLGTVEGAQGGGALTKQPHRQRVAEIASILRRIPARIR